MNIFLAISEVSANLFFEDTSGSMNWSVIVLLAIIFGLGLGIPAVAVGALSDGYSRRRRILTVVSGAALMAVGVLATAVVIHAGEEHTAQEEQIEANRKAFFEDRGVRIPDSQWSSLEFPELEPDKDERYGIAQAELDGRVVSVVLAWEDGEMKLYSTTGDEIEPLASK